MHKSFINLRYIGKYSNRPVSRLNLSQDLKKQLRNGSLVTAPADFAKRIYHKLVSYRIQF